MNGKSIKNQLINFWIDLLDESNISSLLYYSLIIKDKIENSFLIYIEKRKEKDRYFVYQIDIKGNRTLLFMSCLNKYPDFIDNKYKNRIYIKVEN